MSPNPFPDAHEEPAAPFFRDLTGLVPDEDLNSFMDEEEAYPTDDDVPYIHHHDWDDEEPTEDDE